jgi:hypothetical protein
MSKSRRKRLAERPPVHQRPRWLPPAVVVGIGIALVGVVLALLSASKQPPATESVAGAPRLAVDQDRIDYGNVKFNTPIQTVFHVRNLGDQPLKILEEPQVELVEGC